MATYYLGLKYGAEFNPENVIAGTVSVGATADVEVRIETANGTYGMTKEAAVLCLTQIIAFIESNGQAGAGANLPAT